MTEIRECPACDGNGWVIVPDERVEDAPCVICDGTGVLA